jgi:chromosome segregation ATPase
MITKAGVLFVAAVCFTGMAGCVSADVYRLKEQEALNLQRTNQDMQEQNKSLFAERTELQARSLEMKKEKEGLKDRIEKQHAEIVYLESRAAKLEKDGEVQRERMEKLSVKISDLNRENQRLATLTRPENLLRTLGERFADLQKQVDAISGENQKLKSRLVAGRSEEERTGAGEKAMSIGEKPQAVPVWAGQKAEDGRPDQLPQEERAQPLSEDANVSGTGL